MVIDSTRSKIMAAIKGKDTKPEMIVRKVLHRSGFRYRLHSKSLPGHPDIVLAKHNAIILVNGCFWHKHDCHLFNPKRTLSPTWAKKIDANVERDKKNIEFYINSGWKVLVIWECSVVGKTALKIDELRELVVTWLGNRVATNVAISGQVVKK